GHVLLSATRLDAPRRIEDVLSLSPLGVVPEFRRQGIGTQLIAHALEAADSQGVPLVFLEGSPRYYGARGFEGAGAVDFRSPSLRIPEAAFQVARLNAHEPWMTGTFVYSEVFWAFAASACATRGWPPACRKPRHSRPGRGLRRRAGPYRAMFHRGGDHHASTRQPVGAGGEDSSANGGVATVHHVRP
ncbi:GNAT family N-acetyltransferase, partial [Streptomyces sp. NPDC056222]|uniref:GNAT family N-acetyltransferase n=1 Tax=Streptomyces sp. NPDC056222 TaxID=3345749 RepID=UPI0035DBA02A